MRVTMTTMTNTMIPAMTIEYVNGNDDDGVLYILIMKLPMETTIKKTVLQRRHLGGGWGGPSPPKEKEKKKKKEKKKEPKKKEIEKRKKKEGNYEKCQITTYKVLFFPIFH